MLKDAATMDSAQKYAPSARGCCRLTLLQAPAREGGKRDSGPRRGLVLGQRLSGWLASYRELSGHLMSWSAGLARNTLREIGAGREGGQGGIAELKAIRP